MYLHIVARGMPRSLASPQRFAILSPDIAAFKFDCQTNPCSARCRNTILSDHFMRASRSPTCACLGFGPLYGDQEYHMVGRSPARKRHSISMSKLLAQPMLPRHLQPGEGCAVHLVRAVGQPQGARTGPRRGQPEVLADPATAVNLDRTINDSQCH